MSRHYTHGYPDSLEFHRSHALRESPRVYPTRTSSQEENDSEKGEQQPRKRISLAVCIDHLGVGSRCPLVMLDLTTSI